MPSNGSKAAPERRSEILCRFVFLLSFSAVFFNTLAPPKSGTTRLSIQNLDSRQKKYLSFLGTAVTQPYSGYQKYNTEVGHPRCWLRFHENTVLPSSSLRTFQKRYRHDLSPSPSKDVTWYLISVSWLQAQYTANGRQAVQEENSRS